jgi:Pectate lyase superfamily protein/Right handed beta helix region
MHHIGGNTDRSSPPAPHARPSRRDLLGRIGFAGAGAVAATAAATLAGPPGRAAAAETALTSYFDVSGYGAQGDGTTDDTAAIQAAIDAAQAAGGGVVFLPSGSFAVGSTLRITASGVGIRGVGATSEILGTAVDGDIIYAGRGDDAPHAVQEVFFEHFTVRAAVPKTSGAAIYCEYAERFRIDDVKAATQEAASTANNLYDGFYFRYFDTCLLSNVIAACSHTGLTLFGRPDQSYGAGLWLIGGSRVLGCATGVHIAGSSGGIAFEDVDIIGNGTNVLIDDSESGTANRELFFNQCWVDSAGEVGVDIRRNGVNVLQFNCCWVASSGLKTTGHPAGANIHAHPGAIVNPVSVIVSGSRIFNAVGSGIVAESGSWTITGTDIEFNGRGADGGYGILLSDPTMEHTVVSGNTIRHNGYPLDGAPAPLGEGIHVGPRVSSYLITNNIIRENGTAQLVDRGGADKIVKDNLL